jgi:hypothetical protein
VTIPLDRLEAICRIPHALADHSLGDLIAETGYRELRPALTRDLVVGYLAAHPKLVLDWLRYSENKRTPGGWYLMRTGARWVVGRLGGSEQERELRFGSGPEACAEFILRELDGVADGMVGASRSG